jgi:hypothetical protein
MMLRRGRLEHPGTAVTVQGMDYDLEPADQFRELITRTTPLLELLNYRRVVIRSNATQKLAYNYHSCAMGIAGNAWLLSGVFAGAEMAADMSLEQDLMIFPWGLNGITSRYFEGTNFRLETRDQDVTRTQKAAMVANDPIALNSASFCGLRRMRPRNCGNCAKCLRTKAMFMVTLGDIPDVFVDRSFSSETWGRIDLNNSHEVAFFLDVYETARDKGAIPTGLQAAYDARFPRPSMYREKGLKALFRRIKGKPPKRRTLRPMGLNSGPHL